MNGAVDLQQLDEQQLRVLAAQLQRQIQTVSLENDKLKHEMAILKRHKYARTSEVSEPTSAQPPRRDHPRRHRRHRRATGETRATASS